MVLHFVSKILKEVVPLMEHPNETFLAGLEEDLVKLTMKHGQLVGRGLQIKGIGFVYFEKGGELVTGR